MKKIDITYSLDPKFTIEEVVSAWEAHTKELFFRIEESKVDTQIENDFFARILDGEPNSYSIAPIANRSAADESIFLNYGLKLKFKDSDKKIFITEFQEAELPEQSKAKI